MRLLAEMSLANGENVKRSAEIQAAGGVVLTLEIESIAVFVVCPSTDQPRLRFVGYRSGIQVFDESHSYESKQPLEIYLRVVGVRIVVRVE